MRKCSPDWWRLMPWLMLATVVICGLVPIGWLARDIANPHRTRWLADDLFAVPWWSLLGALYAVMGLPILGAIAAVVDLLRGGSDRAR